jgi:RNA polymerase sigma factor (sigma-70 family)
VAGQQQSRGILLDSLLASYLRCDDGCEEVLEELVAAARPVIEGVVRRRLVFISSSAETQDREDVCSEVVVELLDRLRVLKEEDSAAIESFAGYIAAATHHACDEYLRRKYPQRRRLKTRLRYLLSTEPRFAVWEGTGSDNAQKGEWLCGFKSWQLEGNERTQTPAKEWVTVGGASATDRSRQGMVAMLAAIFENSKAPVLLDELVSLVATLWGVTDRVVPMDAEQLHGSRVRDPESQLVSRRSLESLWSEVRNLPSPQRAALLLNLRSGGGDSPIVHLPIMGIATIRQIAEVLGIPAEEFAELWRQLPLDDQLIAQRLSLTRQQVINLRKSARERLRRKMAG